MYHDEDTKILQRHSPRNPIVSVTARRYRSGSVLRAPTHHPVREIYFLRSGVVFLERGWQRISRIQIDEEEEDHPGILLIPQDSDQYRMDTDCNVTVVTAEGLSADTSLDLETFNAMANLAMQSPDMRGPCLILARKLIDQYARAIRGTLYIMQREYEQYKLLSLEEIIYHLKVTSGISKGNIADVHGELLSKTHDTISPQVPPSNGTSDAKTSESKS